MSDGRKLVRRFARLPLGRVVHGLRWRARRVQPRLVQSRPVALVRSVLRWDPSPRTLRQVWRVVDGVVDAAFEELLTRLAWSPTGRPRDRGERRRESRLIVGPLPRVAPSAGREPAEVRQPVKTRVEWSRISRAAFVRARWDAAAGTVRSLLPAMISGRPLAFSGAPARARFTAGNHFTAAFDEDGADALTSAELGLRAMAQVRELFGCCDGSEARPAISVVLASKRPEMIPAAVAQLRAQRFVDIELLVGLHGFSAEELGGLDPLGGAVRSARVVGFPAAATLGEVLQGLTELASTPTLSKWDDDDLYGPHHLIDLWLMRGLTRSVLVGKGTETILLRSSDCVARWEFGQPYEPARMLAGGTLLISAAALRLVGGWDPVSHSVDQRLIRRMERFGLRTTRIHGLEYVLVRHGEAHTWAKDDAHFLDIATARWPLDAVDRVGIVSPGATAAAGDG